jgi:hypothetical protein
MKNPFKKTTAAPPAPEQPHHRHGNGLIGLLQHRQRSYSTQSINRWKSAIKSFENIDNPIRSYLYDLYLDLLLDGQIEATWGKRVDNILNRPLIFIDDAQQDNVIGRLLCSPDMRRLLRDLIDTVLWGFTLIQVNDIRYDHDQECYRIDYDLIPRAHVHPEHKFRCVSRDETQLTRDFLFDEPPLSRYMIASGDPSDKGLLVKAAPYVIYKRGAQGDWAQFSEMFGMPFREAFYDAFDDATRAKIEQALQNWGAGMSFVHPRSVEVKLHDTGGSAASSEIYKDFIAMCNSEISKTILGNTLTTEQGEMGARSLGEVHQDEELAKFRNDERFILSTLNTQFRSILKTFGIDASHGEIAFESATTDWDALQKKWNVISGIAAQVPVDDNFIYESFDIPRPDNYDQLKQAMDERRQASIPASLSADDDFFV